MCKPGEDKPICGKCGCAWGANCKRIDVKLEKKTNVFIHLNNNYTF